MIPEAAVEAAYSAPGAGSYVNKEYVRLMLEAAAPHMLAEAWDEGYQGCYGRYMYEPVPTNPYRRQE